MSQSPTISPPKSRPTSDQLSVEFRILGSFAALRSGRLIPLGGPKQRLVLALLVLEANRVVSADRLIDQLWAHDPPEAARGTLQAYISRLRKALGSDRIEARAPGYVLRATRDEVDSDRFDRLVADAHDRLESDPQAAKSLLDTALELWRGPALDDLAAEQAVRSQVARLEELRLTAIEYRIEARLVLGHHTELVAELERLVSEHPLREPFSASLMLALYRSERQAEALAAFERIRRLVSDELGTDPSPGLRRLHERILKQDPELTPKGRRLRGYELLERIGEGASGVVYRGVQPTVRRDVAIKVVHRTLSNDPEFIRRFEQEAQVVAHLEHPHIVQLHDYWREPEGAYLVMRRLHGGSLKDRLAATGPLTAVEAQQLVDQICSALGFAHRQGVVHRDIRPTNILYDEEGNAYLSDFGIAIEVAVADALRRRYGGLAYYLAPEEIRSAPVSAATDIYCLGLTLHEALTGRHAFGDSPSSEILDRQLTAPTPPMSSARPDLPAAVGVVILRATEKDPAARYPDVSSFAAAFREALTSGAEAAAVPPAIDRNPYKGLRAFEEADSPDFFGREQLTAQLVQRMSETAGPFRILTVVGPSGSGKSSAVRAGLLPAIRRGGISGSARWFIVEMHPGVQPFRELESALLRVAPRHLPSLAEELEWGEGAVLRIANRILPADDSELLLFVDQFEELFTLLPDDRRRNAFLQALADAVMEPASRVRVLITLRADFYDRPLLHPAFGELLASRTYAVTAMRSEELERAIIGPAESTGASFESGLTSSIMSDVVDKPGSLPLLQYALTELFDQRDRSTLKLDVYRRMGGISGALSRKADDLFARLDPGAKETARQVFLRLVSLGEEGSTDSRRRVLRTELAALDVEQQDLERVIELFGTHRFLIFDRDPLTRGQTVEIAHEALLTSWRRLRNWIDSGREDLRTYRRLSVSASDWEASGRDPSFLLRGSRLQQFEGWAKASHIAMSGLEREYLGAGLRTKEKERTEEHVRQRREEVLSKRALNRLRAAVAALLIGVVAAGSLALVAQERGTSAEREARIATARQLAAASAATIATNSDLALQLALQSVEKTRSVDGTVLPEAEETLHAAVQAQRLLLVARGHRAQFSTDGKQLLIVGTEPGKVEVRDAGAGSLISSTTAKVGDYPTEVNTPMLAITPDGKRFVTGGHVHGVAVYDTVSAEFQRVLGPGYCCGDVWISPNGKLVMAVEDIPCGASSGSATYVFDIDSGSELNCLPLQGLWAFSPDGVRAMVATGQSTPNPDPPGSIYIGNLREPGGGEWFRLDAQPDVNGAAWSPDGLLVATSSPNSVIWWDAHAPGKPLLTLLPPAGNFTTLAFSITPGLLATGMSDGSAIVWKFSGADAKPVLRLAGHGGVIRSVAFDPDANRLVTGSDDGFVKVWNITPTGGGEFVSVAGVGGIDISRDGRLIAAGGADGHVRVYQSATGIQVADLASHTSRIEALDLSPDGSFVVSAAADGTVMSDVPGGVEWRLRAAAFAAASMAMSPDAKNVAVPIGGETIAIVDARTGSQLTSIQPAIGCASSTGFCTYLSTPFGRALAFSDDGKYLAIGGGYAGCTVVYSRGALAALLGSEDIDAVAMGHNGRVATVDTLEEGGSVRLYDLAHFGRLVGTLARHSPVTGVAFSPDGSRVATIETDGTLRLWDATTLKQLMVLATDADGRLEFSADGTRLVYGARGEVIRVLALRIDDLIQLAQARLARSEVRAERPSAI
jgi:serine/threonine protein kinase/WD40 repeat protein